ncbi:mucin-3A-like isoform X2 [Xiphophorus maculatus]|uniref:mucin-3A-like isoform X2 n=1 Tax=Xiphophorus maculatus TaxID=8083 RepID=UPI000C6E7DCE|nr:mucin-3A-like isoform X2 [Xiphophorus maculatus]
MQSDTHLLCRVVISFTMIGCLVFIVLLGSFQELQVQALPQAKLTADSSLIKDTDSVTLSCRAPARVSVHQCYFYVNGGTQTHFPCIKTFTGTELLWMRKKSLPSVAEVRCFYTVNYGTVNSPSPHSDVSYITISIVEGDLTEIRKTTRFMKTTSSSNAVFPIQESVTQRTVTVLITGTTKLTTSISSISTSTKSGHVEGELTEISKIPTRSTKTESSSDAALPIQESIPSTTVTVFTTGPREPTKSKTTSTPASSTVTSTSQRTTNVNFIFIDTRILAIAAAVVGGVIVVSILVVAACLIAKRRTGKGLHNRKQANLKDQSVWMKVTDNTEMLPLDKDGVYSVITSAPAADRPAGPGKPAKEKPQTEDSDVYHVYCTIPDLPPPSTRDDRVYCLLQNH